MVVVVVVLAVVVTHLACDHWGTSPTLCCWQALRNAAKSDGVGREDVIIWCPPGTTTSMCLKLAAAHNLGCKSGSTQRDVGQAEASFVCVWGGGGDVHKWIQRWGFWVHRGKAGEVGCVNNNK